MPRAPKRPQKDPDLDSSGVRGEDAGSTLVGSTAPLAVETPSHHRYLRLSSPVDRQGLLIV